MKTKSYYLQGELFILTVAAHKKLDAYLEEKTANWSEYETGAEIITSFQQEVKKQLQAIPNYLHKPLTVPDVSSVIKQTKGFSASSHSSQLPLLQTAQQGFLLTFRLLGLGITAFSVMLLLGLVWFYYLLAQENFIFTTLPFVPTIPYLQDFIVVIPQTLYATFIFSVSVLVFIPLLFILLFGVSLLRVKNLLHWMISLPLLLVWFAALFSTGLVVVEMVPVALTYFLNK